MAQRHPSEEGQGGADGVSGASGKESKGANQRERLVGVTEGCRGRRDS